MALVIKTEEKQYCLRIPAHRFHQGRRNVYSFALDLAQLDGLLPQRVDEDIVKEANRRLSRLHARNIKQYLMEVQDTWVLGSILLGIAPDAVEFHPYNDDQQKASENFGELRILTRQMNTMRIFDGQHRRYAIQEALSELANYPKYFDQLNSLRNASLPIVLYVEDDLPALRQMFADASQTKAIEANTVTRFDERNTFNVVALWLTKHSRLFHNRVELERTVVHRANQNLIAVNQLAATLKTLDVGYNGRVSRERQAQHRQAPEALRARCIAWADEFMLQAREEYASLADGAIADTDIPIQRNSTFAFTVPVIRILAGCYHEWTKEEEDWKPLARYLRTASLKPGGSPDQPSLLEEAGVVMPGGDSPISRSQEVWKAIKFIVGQARKANA